MGGLDCVYLTAHTPRYCTPAAAFEEKLAHPDFRALRDGLVEQGLVLLRVVESEGVVELVIGGLMVGHSRMVGQSRPKVKEQRK